jgi:hypothetical protein
MEDQSKFFNVIIDRTNQKLNSFQAQVIVLESQLQMANDERDMYKKYVEELPGLNFNIEEHNKLKNDYTLLENRMNVALGEQENNHREALHNLNLKHQEQKNQHQEVLHNLNLKHQEQKNQHQEVLHNLNLKHQEELKDLNNQLQEALNVNYEYIEKIKILQSNNSNDTRFIRDQNETLLQEIRRLKAEMAEMSTKK